MSRLPQIILAATAVLVLPRAAATAAAPAEWPLPNLNAASTRSLPASGIDRGNVGRLHVVWRFPLHGRSGDSGSFTATPVIAGGTVYVQDLASTVFALDERSGRLLWRHRFFYAQDPGPNGVAYSAGRVYGATPTSAFALDAGTGKLVWMRRLTQVGAPTVDTAPLVAGGLVYTSTIGQPPGGKGVLFALDAATGAVRWRLSTVKGRWAVPREAGGGGAWYPPSAGGGLVYWGTANPYPYGGTRAHPNGGAYAGRALYTDSLLALDARTGSLRWYDQVTPHDVRDHDFQLPPILLTAGGRPLAVGAGKAGRVIAWDRRTHRRVWQATVGTHRNDHGPLPKRRVPVCPGLLGGVETPMALADGKVLVPVVDLCVEGSAEGYESLAHVDPLQGRGELIALDAATGRRAWRVRLPAPPFGCATAARGVVFTTTLDGTLSAFDTRDGKRLWQARLADGSNACPALARGLLVTGAGVPRPGGSAELEAFSP